ncbi:MAG: terminase TerL endonuclease subunit, partial [Pseudomonadota bacterium]|nr:terminase TerL endonuclease subunit [Pseudomonadota bacterium]
YEAISNHKKITVDIASIGVRQAHISTSFAQTFASQIGEPLKNYHAVGRPPVKNEDTGSILRVLTDDPDAFHGGSARIAFLDEVAHLKKDTLSMAQTGRAKREDAMVWTMSTPDSDRNRPYYSDRDTAAHDLMHNTNDRGVYLLAFNADPEDAVTDNIEVLEKANPGIRGGMPSLEGLQFNYRKLVENGDAAQKNRFIREHLCRFDDNISTFIDLDTWDECAGKVEIPDGAKVFMGVDLSRGGQGDRCDFTSFTVMSILNGKYCIQQKHMLPDANIKKLEARSHMPLSQWIDTGQIELFQGETVEGEEVARQIYSVFEQFDLVECGIDAWTFPEEIRATLLEELRVPMQYRADARSMSQAVAWSIDAIQSKRIVHTGCEVMRAHLKNVELRQSPSGALRPCKNASKSTIDGVISFLLSCSALVNNQTERPSMYSADDIVI